jgi:N-acetyl-1-D-myo-inositol-2-amino-2-deoxy-alpha-D-glucopyranoside deacetylase
VTGQPSLLLVHAHPDDETINNGVTMAHYAAAGVRVTLVTCTLGEVGEILVPELAGLERDKADQLGGYRIGELSTALDALGVGDRRFLGGAGRFRDSGMMGTAGNDHPRAFWRAASDPGVFAAAVAALVQVIDEVRPQVVITYDPDGGYGHPDHIMAHRVTMAAVAAAPGMVRKVYWCAQTHAAVQAGIDALAAHGGTPFDVPADDFTGAVADDLVTTQITALDQLDAKLAALAAHATQVRVDGVFFALSNNVGRAATAVEQYRLAVGEVAGPFDAAGRETDLFAGV